MRIDGQKEGVWVVGIVRAKMQRRDKHGMFDRDGKKRGELGHTVITEGWWKTRLVRLSDARLRGA